MTTIKTSPLAIPIAPPRRGRAMSPANALSALQAKAEGAPTVQRLRALSQLSAQATVQFKKPDVFSKEAFDNPENHLKTANPANRVVEDAGSSGMSSDVYRSAARQLSGKKNRDFVIQLWEGKVDAIYQNGDPVVTEKKRADNIIAAVKALKLVFDFESAALFLRENSLTMSKGGIGLRKVHENPANAPQTHTFHRDAGFVQVASGDLNNTGNAEDKANALNGPKGKGWVQGHAGIANYHHRFYEHVHVDKDSEPDRFEIYAASKDDVEAAQDWGESRKALLTPKGTDATTVAEAEMGKKDSDLQAAKEWNDRQ